VETQKDGAVPKSKSKSKNKNSDPKTGFARQKYQNTLRPRLFAGK